jgi:hypothetical protein
LADPVFILIAAHREVDATVEATAAEVRRATETEKAAALEQGVFAGQNWDEFSLFVELTKAIRLRLRASSLL